MLVLSRGENQRVIIEGGRIVVTVCAIRWDHDSQTHKVRLGFEADKSIPIHREEIEQDASRTQEGW